MGLNERGVKCKKKLKSTQERKAREESEIHG